MQLEIMPNKSLSHILPCSFKTLFLPPKSQGSSVSSSLKLTALVQPLWFFPPSNRRWLHPGETAITTT